MYVKLEINILKNKNALAIFQNGPDLEALLKTSYKFLFQTWIFLSEDFSGNEAISFN